jgi:hypothetical protein
MKIIKKTTLAILIMACLGATVYGQAKKPVIMVVPSDNWCIQQGFTMEFDNQGSKMVVPDYKASLQNSSELLLVIGKINTMMADRGFPLKNLETEMKNLEQESAEMSMITSKGGAEMAENPIDIIKRTAKADIIIQLTWSVNITGPKRSITFNLQGLDAYTSKQISGAQGTGAPSFSAELPVLLEEAVLAHMGNFSDRLQDHFDDMFENGREIKLQVKMWESADIDLEEEFDYKGETLELLDILDDWMAENSVKGRYSFVDGTENFVKFEQVRIPLYDEKGRAMDARRFARDLRSFLGNEPFNQECKVYTRGLGEVWIIVGEK